ncbi:TPA: hypothetical protein ACGD48_004792 [Serratia marcescens]
MKNIIDEKVRMDFEEFAAKELRLTVKTIQGARRDDQYAYAFDSMSIMQPLNGWWKVWKAAKSTG